MPGRSDLNPIVLVDARNVIRSRWPNFGEERFLELTRTWGEGEDVSLVVVFDGQAPETPHEAQLDGRMSVVGTGTESADDWIAREAPRFSLDGRRIWLVSSDRELRERVAPYVERVLGGGSFATWLEALERDAQAAD